MDTYSLVTLLHVAGAVALLSGSVFGSPAVRAAIRRAQTIQEMRAFMRIGEPLHVLEPAAAVVVLATGIFLTGAAGFWRVGWIQVSVVCWLVNAAVAGAVVKPAMAHFARGLDASADGPVGPTLDRLRHSARWAIGGDVLLANDVAVLYLMVMQPAPAASLLAVVAVNLLVMAARVWWRGRSRSVR